MRKGEIACNKQFLLFSMFSIPHGTDFSFQMHFQMSSATRFNLDQSKILSSGIGLNRFFSSVQLIRECTDEELMEIVLPRLAKVITLWEFLLMKVEKGDPPKPHVDDIYKEYEKLHLNVKKLCQEYLQFIPETEAHNDAKILKVGISLTS